MDPTRSSKLPRGSSGGLRRDSHVPGLDGVRGVAAIMVTLVHFVGNAEPWTSFEHILVKAANYGLYGVDLFFVLSGYLITGILYDSKGSSHHFRNFYMRRVLRIFPLYYGVLFLVFIVVPLFHPMTKNADQQFLHNQHWLWLYMANIPQAIS